MRSGDTRERDVMMWIYLGVGLSPQGGLQQKDQEDRTGTRGFAEMVGRDLHVQEVKGPGVLD